MAIRWLLSVILFAGSGFSQLPSETDRLMATARLWVTVEYFHPNLALQQIDWDEALIKAIPKIRTATSRTDYLDALSGMLQELHDPQTRLFRDGEPVPSTYAVPATYPQMTLVNTARDRAFILGSGSPLYFLVDFSGATAQLELSKPAAAEPLVPAPIRVTAEYNEPYPPVEARLLAAIRLYGAIHYFFAYKDLMDEDWEDVFPTYLTKLIEAKDALTYNLVLSDLLTHLTDTNVVLHSQALESYFGEAPVGLQFRLLDKYPIVTQVLDPAAKAAGVEPGDVLKRIAGVSTTDVFRQFVQYIPASTPQRSGYDTMQKVTSGPAGSEVELTIENSKGEAHVVKLSRQAAKAAAQRDSEAVRILPGNIGYLDLERLPIAEIEMALAKVKEAKALILDLRASSAPAASALARHLTSQGNVAASIVTTPLALHPDLPTEGIATQTASTFTVKTLAAPLAPQYKGKTVALIDERTIGEAEYAGLLFEAANKTEFIGVPSAGAVSATAELSLPGGITLSYSTEDIRHANGGKLQRLGIQPNITAPTTAKGLHAGKDEPLEAALAHLAK